MKSLVTLWVCLTGLCHITFPQDSSTIDSLKTQIEALQNTDNNVALAEKYYELAHKYYKGGNDSLAHVNSNTGLKLVTNTHTETWCKLMFTAGLSKLFLTGNPAVTQPYLDSISAHLHEFDNFDFKLNFHYQYGSNLANLSRFEEAETELLQAEKMYLKRPLEGFSIISTYSNLAVTAQAQQKFETSLEYARRGIEISKGSTDYHRIGDLYYNNSSSFLELGLRTDAKVNLERALDFYKKADKPWNIAVTNAALAELLSNGDERSDFKEAQNYFVMAIDELEALGDQRYASIIKVMAGQNLRRLERYSESLDFINSSINYLEGKDDPFALSGAYLAKAKSLNVLGQTDSTEVYALKELEHALDAEDKREQGFVYEFLTDFYEAKGDFQSALMYSRKFNNSQSSMSDENLQESLAKEKVTQNVEATEEARSTAELKAELLSSRNKFYIVLASALGLILLIGGYLFYQLASTRKQLESQNVQLQQLNATKDKFFGIIAHDIRSPIAALEGVGEQMEYYLEKNDTSKLKRLASRVDSTALKLSDLLNNLLNWALLQTGMIPYHPSAISISYLVDENFKLFEDLAQLKGLTLENHIKKDSDVFADENATSTIIRNLLNNAIKFTPQGGIISIGSESTKSTTMITINDTGTGISAEKLEKLFTLDKASKAGTAGEKGSGLGLMLCKELIELNRGTIRVISELGKGSSFVVSLPKS